MLEAWWPCRDVERRATVGGLVRASAERCLVDVGNDEVAAEHIQLCAAGATITIGQGHVGVRLVHQAGVQSNRAMWLNGIALDQQFARAHLPPTIGAPPD